MGFEVSHKSEVDHALYPGLRMICEDPMEGVEIHTVPLEEVEAEKLAKALRLPMVKLSTITFDENAVRLIPEALARKHSSIAYAMGVRTRKTLLVAMLNPNDIMAQQELSFATGYQVQPVVAVRSEIFDAIDREYTPDRWIHDFLNNVEEGSIRIVEDGEGDSIRVKDEKSAPVVKLLNLVIQKGIREAASDIHLEATSTHLVVRGRVQGILKEFMQVPKWLQEPVISRLKILAKLDITERRRPQDGRLKVLCEGNDVDLRISTLPTHNGEKAVIRILGSGSKIPSTAELGLGKEAIEILKRCSDQPQGLVLVTGPTGSGKTTTLYSLVNEKRAPTINIVTVEDPIEIQLEGINQVQVNAKAGLTFAGSLRSILRQDPDVILIGEIRDEETAEIAVNAAQTGHLVLSTLHTNSTVATITRLLDLGIDPYLVSTSLNLIMAQRLLRTLCPHCKEQYTPAIGDVARLHLVGFAGPLYRSRGCSSCNMSGYTGRTGIYEMLRITSTLRELIARHANESELKRAALAGGTVPLLDAAVAHVKNGTTTLDEVFRVVQLEEDEGAHCPKCDAVVDTKFASCPYCMLALRRKCNNCTAELKPEWKICPFCTTAAGAAPATAGVSVSHEIAPEDDVPAIASSGHPPKILVVDDDEIIRDTVAGALSLMELSPEVQKVEDGEEALKVIHEWQPDMVITDVNMPKVNGFELCTRIRSELSTAFIPVLMLTVSSDEENRTKGFLLGTDDFMEKPFSIPELNARVARLLRRTYGY